MMEEINLETSTKHVDNFYNSFTNNTLLQYAKLLKNSSFLRNDIAK